MDLSWLAAVAGFAVAMAGTPGPNNMMVATSGANFGFRRSLPLMAGIACGVAAIMVAGAATGASVLGQPWIATTLRWAGVAYLLWLAWTIATIDPAPPGNEQRMGSVARPMGFVQGALFQFVNPKLWAMVAGAVVTYGGMAPDRTPLVLGLTFGLVFGAATFVSTAAWTLIGAGAGRMIRTRTAMRVFNGMMAALLVASLVPIVLG